MLMTLSVSPGRFSQQREEGCDDEEGRGGVGGGRVLPLLEDQ